MTQPPPPTKWRLAYRLLGLRLPAEYRVWVAEDVTRKSFLNWRIARSFLWAISAFGLYDLAQTTVYQRPVRATMLRQIAIAIAISILASRDSLVRRALRFQRIDKLGRPTRPRRLGLLDNSEAVVGVAMLAILGTGASAVYAHYGLRATGPAVAPCRKPDAALQARLKAGFKKPGVELVTPRVVKYDNGAVVVTLYKEPAAPRALFDVFVLQHETIYEVHSPGRAAQSPTTFPAPAATDRVSPDAVKRAFECLQKASAR